MIRSRLLGYLRRRAPQTIRVRLSVLYAVLFLAAGALLLALTYGLVASSLPRTTSLSKLTSTQEAQLNLECKRATQTALAKSKGAPQPHSVPGACNKLASESANAATANQRDQALHNLLVFSLLGLGVMTLASGGLGWVMAGRVLRPVSTITEAARRASERHLGERLESSRPSRRVEEPCRYLRRDARSAGYRVCQPTEIRCRCLARVADTPHRHEDRD